MKNGFRRGRIGLDLSLKADRRQKRASPKADIDWLPANSISQQPGRRGSNCAARCQAEHTQSGNRKTTVISVNFHSMINFIADLESSQQVKSIGATFDSFQLRHRSQNAEIAKNGFNRLWADRCCQSLTIATGAT